MTSPLSLAVAQVNPTVGDVDGNADLIRAASADAHGADLLVAGELALSGYPPEDLVLKRAFQDRVERVVGALAHETPAGGPALLVGAPWRVDGGRYNSVLLLADGRLAEVRCKHELPNYGVFDEKRVFKGGPLPKPIRFRGAELGVMVCEDMWTPPVTRHLAQQGAEILVVMNGSPFETDKIDTRFELASGRVADTGRPLLYVNLVGGQDELVFDGASFAIEPSRGLAFRAPSWAAGVSRTRWLKEEDAGWRCEGSVEAQAEGVEAIYLAMLLGLRDYVGKNGFPGVIQAVLRGVGRWHHH